MHSWRRRQCGQPLVEDVNNQAGRWYGSSASRMTLQESAHVPKVGHRAGGLRSRRREPRPASQRGGESDLPPDFSPRHRRRRRCRSAHSCSRRRHAVTAASIAPKRTNASRMTVQAGPPAPQQFLNPHADTLSCRDSLKGRLAHMWGSGALVMTHSEANTAEMAFLAVLWHQSDIAPSRVGADDPTSKQIPGHTVVFADVAGSPTHPHLVHGASRAARRRCLWSSSWLFRRRHARGSKGAGVTAATPLRKCPRILRYGCRPPIAGLGRGPATPPALPSHVRPIDQLGEPTLLICGPIGRGHESRHGAATGNVRLIDLWHVAVRAWSPDTPWLHQTPQGTLSWSGVRECCCRGMREQCAWTAPTHGAQQRVAAVLFSTSSLALANMRFLPADPRARVRGRPRRKAIVVGTGGRPARNDRSARSWAFEGNKECWCSLWRPTAMAGAVLGQRSRPSVTRWSFCLRPP